MTSNAQEITPEANSQRIHDYSRRVVCCKNRLAKIRQGDMAISFLEKLHLFGLEDGES